MDFFDVAKRNAEKELSKQCIESTCSMNQNSQHIFIWDKTKAEVKHFTVRWAGDEFLEAIVLKHL